jgi:hypothetical protein
MARGTRAIRTKSNKKSDHKSDHANDEAEKQAYEYADAMIIARSGSRK